MISNDTQFEKKVSKLCWELGSRGRVDVDGGSVSYGSVLGGDLAANSAAVAHVEDEEPGVSTTLRTKLRGLKLE